MQPLCGTEGCRFGPRSSRRCCAIRLRLVEYMAVNGVRRTRQSACHAGERRPSQSGGQINRQAGWCLAAFGRALIRNARTSEIFGYLYLLVLLACPGQVHAQETRFIDLTSVAQRTELRHPPSPPSECEIGNCVGSGSGGGSVVDGAPDTRDPRALGIYLLRITPTEIDPANAFEVEFQVRNTGTIVLDIPVSPHLSDLQPIDESAEFSYASLALVVEGEGELRGSRASATGFIQLYGTPEHTESMMVLKPGEWIRVRANVKLISWPAEPTAMFFRGNFWLRKNTFKPAPGGGFSEMRNLYPNLTPTPPIAIRLRHASSDRPGKDR